MRLNFIRSSSILSKFLFVNLIIFLFLGIFTILYLQAIKPNLIKNRSIQHSKVIENISNHLNRLEIEFNKKSVLEFLLSSRFLFQNLDRLQLYDLNFKLIADTNTLDLAKESFVESQKIEETKIGKLEKEKDTKIKNKEKKQSIFNIENFVKEHSKKNNQKLVLGKRINNDFYVITIKSFKKENSTEGYIVISEVANDILVAVTERKNFILRTVFYVTIVIIIFSVILNRYILKPIRVLVQYTKAKKEKDQKIDKVEKYLSRADEVGLLSRSLNEMTEDLYKRINIAETFSSDLTHEIRNPLASLKAASEVLDKTIDNNKRTKLITIIKHDVERIDRLITDYSQMLKDEATFSRAEMKKIDLTNVLNSVTEDFNNDLSNLNKKIIVKVISNGLNGKKPIIYGVESKIEQVIANILDNSISFSYPDSEILIFCKLIDNKIELTFEDEGPGFNEKKIDKVFSRFYSNRPEKFGEHSGLGLNIVKNIVELHGGIISASNKDNGKKGARIKIILPIYK
ncbi:MAG: hypothetical protein CBC24_06205 [Candidatus Pelagibacter sp. TMED64]|nr:hypothetical protein [Candidatus Pelagibacter sp.]OUU65022.1 MAG: hypothetical protein CBC24_06205 [Candidatus Pelagibacter sp. TMED64]|tara:strand:- start:846 stop:2387 length:1542 start_codon:yes stop_codon:yes gene_type:complete